MHFLIFLTHQCLESTKAGHNTLEAHYEEVVKSFNICWEGTYHTEPSDGKGAN